MNTVKQGSINLRFWAVGFVVIGVLAIAFGVSAQETPPNTPPSATAKSGSGVRKLNGQKKADAAQQDKTACFPVMSCQECCCRCPIEEPTSQTEAEKAKADALNVLYRRYLKATVYGAVIALLGLGVLIWQSILFRRSANSAKESADGLWAGQRAYVVIGPHGNPAEDLMSTDVRVQFEMVNKGQTPAYDLAYESWFEILPFPFEGFSSSATYFKATEKIALYPNSAPIHLNAPLLRELTSIERKSLKDTALYACVRIRVEYRDARSPGRYAEFGYFVQKTSFGYLAKYNDAN